MRHEQRGGEGKGEGGEGGEEEEEEEEEKKKEKRGREHHSSAAGLAGASLLPRAAIAVLGDLQPGREPAPAGAVFGVFEAFSDMAVL